MCVNTSFFCRKNSGSLLTLRKTIYKIILFIFDTTLSFKIIDKFEIFTIWLPLSSFPFQMTMCDSRASTFHCSKNTIQETQIITKSIIFPYYCYESKSSSLSRKINYEIIDNSLQFNSPLLKQK